MGASLLHCQISKQAHCKPVANVCCSQGSTYRGGKKRFLPPKVHVSLTEFASTLVCRDKRTRSTPALILPPSEDIAKENSPGILEEQKGDFSRYFCKQLGQVISATGQFWPRADDVYLTPGRRDAHTAQGCLLVLRDVLFAIRNIQALSEHSTFLPAPLWHLGDPHPVCTHHVQQLECCRTHCFASGALGRKQQAESINQLHSPEIRQCQSNLFLIATQHSLPRGGFQGNRKQQRTLLSG